MGGFLIRRFIYGALTIWGISVLTFMIFFLIPTGDPAVRIAGKSPTPELIADINKKYHFNESLPKQYFYTMKQILTGDIKSFNTGQKVLPMITKAMPVTVSLVIIASSIYLTIGIALGIFGATRPGRLDRLMTIFALIGLSLPTIWLAMILLLVFTVSIPLFPPGDYVTIYQGGFIGWLYHLLLPAFVLVIVSTASYALISRTGIRSAMKEEWVKTARAKGLNSSRVFGQHIFRIGIIQVVVIFGLDLAGSLTGAIFTENIFGLPGLGSVVRTGIDNLDFPILLCMTLFGAILIVVANTVVDIIQAALDPRIRVD